MQIWTEYEFLSDSRTYFLLNPYNEALEIFFDKFAKIGLSFWFMRLFSRATYYYKRFLRKDLLNPRVYITVNLLGGVVDKNINWLSEY